MANELINEELYDALKMELQIIKNLVSMTSVKNLDESILYCENLLKKYENHIKI
jgi:hypothetical protein